MPVKWHICATYVFVCPVRRYCVCFFPCIHYGKGSPMHAPSCTFCVAVLWKQMKGSWELLASLLCPQWTSGKEAGILQLFNHKALYSSFVAAKRLSPCVKQRHFVFNMQLVKWSLLHWFRSVSILSPWKLFLFLFYRWHFLLWTFICTSSMKSMCLFKRKKKTLFSYLFLWFPNPVGVLCNGLLWCVMMTVYADILMKWPLFWEWLCCWLLYNIYKYNDVKRHLETKSIFTKCLYFNRCIMLHCVPLYLQKNRDGVKKKGNISAELSIGFKLKY